MGCEGLRVKEGEERSAGSRTAPHPAPPHTVRAWHCVAGTHSSMHGLVLPKHSSNKHSHPHRPHQSWATCMAACA